MENKMPGIIMILLLATLTLFLAATSIDFMKSILPATLGNLPIMIVAATGVGALVWKFAGHRYAKNDTQSWIAIAMVFINILADVIMFAGEIMRSGTALQLPDYVFGGSIIMVVLILGGNAIALFAYMIFDPAVELARQKHKQEAELKHQEAEAAHQLAMAQAATRAATMQAQIAVEQKTAETILGNADTLAAQQAQAQAAHQMDALRNKFAPINSGGKSAGPLPPTDTAAR